MKKSIELGDFLKLIALLLIIGFVIRIGADVYQYQNNLSLNSNYLFDFYENDYVFAT